VLTIIKVWHDKYTFGYNGEKVVEVYHLAKFFFTPSDGLLSPNLLFMFIKLWQIFPKLKLNL